MLNIFFLVVCGTDKLHLASGQTQGQAAAGVGCVSERETLRSAECVIHSC